MKYEDRWCDSVHRTGKNKAVHVVHREGKMAVLVIHRPSNKTIVVVQFTGQVRRLFLFTGQLRRQLLGFTGRVRRLAGIDRKVRRLLLEFTGQIRRLLLGFAVSYVTCLCVLCFLSKVFVT